MEIVIALAIFAGLAYYLFSKHRQMEAEQESAPHKVETPTLADAPVVQPTPGPVVEVKVETPAPVKAKPRRPRQPVQKTAAKPVAKPAAKPAKKPAAIQAASKAKKPRTPKAK